jgi:hypothetical protein
MGEANISTEAHTLSPTRKIFAALTFWFASQQTFIATSRSGSLSIDQKFGRQTGPFKNAQSGYFEGVYLIFRTKRNCDEERDLL